MSELHCELLRECRRHDGGLSIHLKGDHGAVLREQLRAGGVGRSTAPLSAGGEGYSPLTFMLISSPEKYFTEEQNSKFGLPLWLSS